VHILGIMNQTISEPRREMSSHAPRIITLKVRPEKIREIIGPGGKVIRGIVEETGVKIDVEDDGTVMIASNDEAASRRAVEMVQLIVAEPEVGKIYRGTVRKIMDFGAFVEILPGTDGLVHISQLCPGARASRHRRAQRRRRGDGEGPGDRQAGEDQAQPQRGARRGERQVSF
jgi:polyribonucleotide nucleotidyltransferase